MSKLSERAPMSYRAAIYRRGEEESVNAMKTVRWLLGVALALVACSTAPSPKAVGTTACLAPGARCDFDGQCCSHICDAYDCRGPMPPPGGP